MSIKELTFHGLRNLAPTTLQPSPRINVLHGDNGSGKTSVLEGIHVLGMGRSFRTRQLKHAIQTDAPYMTLHGRLAGDPEVTLGVRRLRTQRELELRLRGRRGCAWPSSWRRCLYSSSIPMPSGCWRALLPGVESFSTGVCFT